MALLAFASNSVSLTRNDKMADSVSAAAGLAQDRLEHLRSLAPGAPEHSPGAYQDNTTLAADGSADGPFTRTWTVSAINTPRNGLKTITVDVSWRDSRTHSTRVSA